MSLRSGHAGRDLNGSETWGHIEILTTPGLSHCGFKGFADTGWAHPQSLSMGRIES